MSKITLTTIKKDEREINFSAETMLALELFSKACRKEKQANEARQKADEAIKLVPKNELTDYIEVTDRWLNEIN